MEVAKALVKQLVSSKPPKNKRVIAICGAADLGKTHLSRNLKFELQKLGLSASHLILDSYLIPRPKRIEMGISGYDVCAYNINKLRTSLGDYLNEKPIEYQDYNHELGSAYGPLKTLELSDYLLIDGLHSMHPEVSPLIDYSIFIYTNDKNLRAIRHRADLEKRKQSIPFSLKNMEFELEKYKNNVEQYKNKADILFELGSRWEYSMYVY